MQGIHNPCARNIDPVCRLAGIGCATSTCIFLCAPCLANPWSQCTAWREAATQGDPAAGCRSPRRKEIKEVQGSLCGPQIRSTGENRGRDVLGADVAEVRRCPVNVGGIAQWEEEQVGCDGRAAAIFSTLVPQPMKVQDVGGFFPND